MSLFWSLCSNPLNILSILLPIAQCLHCYVFIMSPNLIREILSYYSSKCAGYWHFYIWIRESTYQISHKHKNLWGFLLELYWTYRSIGENWSLYDIESSYYWSWYTFSLFSNVILSYCEYDYFFLFTLVFYPVILLNSYMKSNSLWIILDFQ